MTASMYSLDDPVPGPPPTQTAVIVPVLAAEQVIGEHHRRLDRAASWGVPPHITVLYPFVPPEAVDRTTGAALLAAVRSVDAFECTFAATDWFGSDALWLAPRPAEPLRRLTLAVWAAFPACPPYEGQYDDIVPHLTVGELAMGGLDDLRAAEAAVRVHLPLTAWIDHALLIAGSSQPRSWRTVLRLPLGSGHGKHP
jgi:hypothetical protein